MRCAEEKKRNGAVDYDAGKTESRPIDLSIAARNELNDCPFQGFSMGCPFSSPQKLEYGGSSPACATPGCIPGAVWFESHTTALSFSLVNRLPFILLNVRNVTMSSASTI